MNALTERKDDPALPTLLTARLDHAMRLCIARLEPPITPAVKRYSISSVDAPTEPLRQALVARRAALDRWLEPCGHRAAAEAYQKLAANLDAKNVTDEFAAREMMGFVEATANLPLFALTAACDAFIRGRVGDGKWAPKVGEVCIEANRRVAEAGLAKQRREIDSVLDAEIIPAVTRPDRKARLLQEAAEFVAKSRSMADASRRPRASREQVEQDAAFDLAIAEGRLDPRPMPKLSPYILAQLREKYGPFETLRPQSEDAA